MPENKAVKINLHIYDVDVPINVDTQTEPYYRKACNLINERLNLYFGNYKGQINDKEILYYALIDIAVKLFKEVDRNDTVPFENTIGKLTKEIDEALTD